VSVLLVSAWSYSLAAQLAAALTNDSLAMRFRRCRHPSPLELNRSSSASIAREATVTVRRFAYTADASQTTPEEAVLHFAPRAFAALIAALIVMSGCRQPQQPEPPSEPPTPQSPVRG